jgi:hypothetical protein
LVTTGVLDFLTQGKSGLKCLNAVAEAIRVATENDFIY